jgi:hypothetical protein
MKMPALLALIVLSASACIPAGEVSGGTAQLALAPPADAAVVPAADLLVWTADHSLEQSVLRGAERLWQATSLVIRTDPEMTDPGAVPMFWEDRQDTDYLGVAFNDEHHRFAAIDANTPPEVLDTVVLHELLHELGVGHVDSGAGVLSPEIWDAFPLTTADLEAVCAVRACSAFVPEACVVL